MVGPAQSGRIIDLAALDLEQMRDLLTGRKVHVTYSIVEGVEHVREFVVDSVKEILTTVDNGPCVAFTDADKQHRVVPLSRVRIVGRVKA